MPTTTPTTGCRGRSIADERELSWNTMRPHRTLGRRFSRLNHGPVFPCNWINHAKLMFPRQAGKWHRRCCAGLVQFPARDTFRRAIGRSRGPRGDFGACVRAVCPAAKCCARRMPRLRRAPWKANRPRRSSLVSGPEGLTISSDDLDALDEFERLLSAAADGSGEGPMAIFYLKYAKAQAVAQALETLLAGGSSGDSEGSSETTSRSRRSLVSGAIQDHARDRG